MSKRRRNQPASSFYGANTDLFEAMGVRARGKQQPPATPPIRRSSSKPASARITELAAANLAPPFSMLRQAAARLGLSKSTLDKMRCTGSGPRFIKSTDRAVRYDPAGLDAWISGRRRQSTTAP